MLDSRRISSKSLLIDGGSDFSFTIERCIMQLIKTTCQITPEALASGVSLEDLCKNALARECERRPCPTRRIYDFNAVEILPPIHEPADSSRWFHVYGIACS